MDQTLSSPTSFVYPGVSDVALLLSKKGNKKLILHRMVHTSLCEPPNDSGCQVPAYSNRQMDKIMGVKASPHKHSHIWTKRPSTNILSFRDSDKKYLLMKFNFKQNTQQIIIDFLIAICYSSIYIWCS